MFKVNSNTRSFLRRVSDDLIKYGDSRSVAIDQTLGKSFNIDPETGRPDYYITRLIRESSNVGFEQAFAQLDEFRSKSLPEDMSTEDALGYLKPRSCQTAAEIISWQTSLRSRLAAQKQAKEQAAAAEKQAKDDAAIYESLLANSKTSEK